MPYQADIAIIGAGVIGLAIASRVAGENRDVYVLEKNGTFGREQSSRNSEVIHAGIYYRRDSLKARMCLEGNSLIYQLCDENGIAYRKCGKIIVATSEIEAAELEKLYMRGRDNGVPLRMLSRRELAQLEPNVKGMEAFLSPTTGVVDSYSLIKYFLSSARDSGANLVYRAEVTAIEKIPGGYKVGIKEPGGLSSLTTRVLINCAGLNSDRMAEIAGIDIVKAGYKLHWCKGEYYIVSGAGNRLINSLIYPVPMDISVGVHVCLDVDWRLRLGPLFYYVNEVNYSIDDSRKREFLESSMMRALPFIGPADLEPDSAGVMAMLQAKGEGFRDFVIRHEHDRGFPGFINLIGIESPGLTSSAAIAEYISQMINETL